MASKPLPAAAEVRTSLSQLGWPHRFRHHFSHAWLDRDWAEGDLMELTAGLSRRCCTDTAAACKARGRAATTTSS